jgi:signal transduction histidine kinase
MGHDIAASANIWKERRQVLKIKRDSLFGEYVKRPHDCHLALEIKRIDDEIAEGNQKEQEGNERPKVRRQQALVSSWTKMKSTTTFWMQQLRFAQANLDYLKYSKGRANIDQKRLRTLIKTQESQMEQCELAIHEENLRARNWRFYATTRLEVQLPVSVSLAVSTGEDGGSRFWANVIITALRDDGGKLIGFAKVTRDFTERVRVYNDLQAARQKLEQSEKSLRQLSRHLLRTQDEERRRIGRDLHDSVGQYLSALKMKLATLSPTRNSGITQGIAECTDV